MVILLFFNSFNSYLTSFERFLRRFNKILVNLLQYTIILGAKR